MDDPSGSKRINEGIRLSLAASSFIGVPFRLHGRDPETGLDCVGLLNASLTIIGRSPCPVRGYRLKNASIQHWLDRSERSDFLIVTSSVKAGDVLLSTPGPGQYHLMIADSTSSFVHAHAGLRRVVRQPLDNSQILHRHWRLQPA